MPSFKDSADYLPELAEFVAIPSVSRDSNPPDMRAAAQWLAGQLAFANARLHETDGNPVVAGEWLGAAGAPTVLVYGHYDVQPTGSLDEWRTPPFELTVADGKAYGRGATDDKGPILVVLKTAQAFLDQSGGLPLNVKFLFEGEEEIGSPNLPAFLRANAEQFAADLVISADGAQWRPTEPSVSIASKGLAALDITVAGAGRDLHSGRYGGTVQNPVHSLAQLLAGLHDDDGRVAVPGFYDGVPDLTAQERADIAAVPFDDAAYADELGVPGLYGEPGYSTLERLWMRPTLEINGITGGGPYTVIPHAASAHVTCRLVPGQRPAAVIDAIRAHVSNTATPGVTVRVTAEKGGAAAYTIDPRHPAVTAARHALAAVYPGQDVINARIGGTLPGTVLFEEVLDAKTLFFSFSIADEMLHAPNEYMRIHRLGEGMRAWSLLWRLLSEQRPGAMSASAWAAGTAQ
ncbi:MAG TPA: dipeptidase [Trebonia sp.]|jgi:acetylornithine deacetylase/succinyl-diaminopimelate desuccinylase-like protein|nr:dipeptidase [Trebonia sp.]